MPDLNGHSMAFLCEFCQDPSEKLDFLALLLSEENHKPGNSRLATLDSLRVTGKGRQALAEKRLS